MNTLHLLLDAPLWAVARALDADALLLRALTARFARWMAPGEALDADPLVRLRLAIGGYEAVEAGLAPARDALSTLLEGLPDGPADPRVDRLLTALDSALTDSVRRRIVRLEAWQAVFRAAERAHLRADHPGAVERFTAAAALAEGSPAPLVLSLERLARALLVTGRPAEAGAHARRALLLAESRGMPRIEGLAELVGITAHVAAAHPAVHQIVAGLLAVEQRDAVTAAERLSQAAGEACEAGRADYEMRARGALAVVRLAVGAGQAAGVEARRAAALARDAALDDLGGLLEVLASAGDQLSPDARPRVVPGEPTVSRPARDPPRSAPRGRSPRCG